MHYLLASLDGRAHVLLFSTIRQQDGSVYALLVCRHKAGSVPALLSSIIRQQVVSAYAVLAPLSTGLICVCFTLEMLWIL